MEKITWTDEMNLGIPVIDKQHKEFVNILNEMYECIFTLEKQSEVRELLDKLENFAKYHFATEEKYFAEFGYSGSKNHCKIHEAMHKQVQEFIARYENKEDILMELIDFVEDWLINHLSNQDKQYVSCFKKNGL